MQNNLTTEQQERVRKFYTALLPASGYEKIRGTYHDYDGFCGVGVALDLIILEYPEKYRWVLNSDAPNGRCMFGEMTHGETMFPGCDGALRKMYGFSGDELTALITSNDVAKSSSFLPTRNVLLKIFSECFANPVGQGFTKGGG